MRLYSYEPNFDGIFIGEIRKNEEVELNQNASFIDLVKTIIKLKPNQYLTIPSDYNQILLDDNVNRFRKKGLEAKVEPEKFNKAENAITTAVARALNSLVDESGRDNGLRYRGYGWIDSRDTPHSDSR